MIEMLFSLTKDDITKIPHILERPVQEVFLYYRWQIQKSKELNKKYK